MPIASSARSGLWLWLGLALLVIVADQITKTLRTRKEGLLRVAYLTALRGDATIVNHLARRVVQAKGMPPST